MNADFLDSNVFVYLFDETDSQKRATAQRLVQEGLESGQTCISFQVVQETLHVVTQKLARPLSREDAQRLLDDVLAPLWRVMPSPSLYQRGLALAGRYRFAFYDSLIVAAALDAGCTRLWSEDLQDGQKIGQLTIQNPFRVKAGPAGRRTKRG
jgi:predicted nucleic acid-binding protein